MDSGPHPSPPSYRAHAFDGCQGCSSVALEAVVQSALYVLASAAPALVGEPGVALEMHYRLAVRLASEERTMLEDEIEASQTISLEDDEGAGEGEERTAEDAAVGVGSEAIHAASSMGTGDRRSGSPPTINDDAGLRLEDCQGLIDRLELAASGCGVEGAIDGRLFARERLACSFEIAVLPGG